MKIITLCLVFTLFFTLSVPVTTARAHSKDLDKASDRAAKAASVFREIMNAPDKSIPQGILDKAEAIAVFPSVLKAGFILGGRGGTGLVSIRDPQTRQWGAPIFLKLGGGDIGLQIGGEAIDVVLVGMNRHAADVFLKDRFRLGGELSASAGPVGRAGEASTDLPTVSSEFLSYSRSKGLFAGVVINGSKIWQDKGLNDAVYGQKKIGVIQPVSRRAVPSSVMVFVDTLKQYTKGRGA